MAFPVLQFASLHRDRSSMCDDFMDIFNMSEHVVVFRSAQFCFALCEVILAGENSRGAAPAGHVQ